MAAGKRCRVEQPQLHQTALTAAESAQELAEALDALLPQTQCGLCGYAGCRPYAAAMAVGTADINRCPPGGRDVIEDLACRLGRAPRPLDAACGVTQEPAVALIDEAWCIGCTLCIQACPVDAIAGAAKVMHTVIAADCTGCELCIPPCPVDCIQMVAVTRPTDRKHRIARAAQARSRYLARKNRIAGGKQQATLSMPGTTATARGDKKKAAVARAVARAQARINREN